MNCYNIPAQNTRMYEHVYHYYIMNTAFAACKALRIGDSAGYAGQIYTFFV